MNNESAAIAPASKTRLHVYAPQWGGNISDAAGGLSSVSLTVHADAADAVDAAGIRKALNGFVAPAQMAQHQDGQQ